MTTIIAFVLILGVLILVHEIGHFVTARKLGVDVEEFGIGFPPKMFSLKKGDVTYSINWIPIGGFVKIKGESGGDANDPKSFAAQAAWKKSIILSAGVMMNFFLAIVLLSLGFYFGLPQSIDQTTPLDRVRDRSTVILEVLKDSPAEQAGIKMGDKIITINNETHNNADDVYNEIEKGVADDMKIVVDRRGEELEFSVRAAELVGRDKPMIGVSLVDTGVISYNIFESIWQGISTAGILIWRVLEAFGMIITNLFTQGKLSAEVSGPVGVAVITAQIVKMGWLQVMQFAAILSINLGIINILPFPALDGGRLLFVFAESLTRKKLSEKTEAIIHNSGFILLIVLLIFITLRDIRLYKDNIIGFFTNLF
ncbi:RIP metalloprotease RseP [Candidatus Parcubacteria bacterium]|nr:MAG: RIP metalloprotease RseP [Candidatus Parcubacteria bacterium]